MSYKHLAGAMTLLTPVLLSGCVDSSYNLEDVKDVRVEVKDLTLPVNLDPITLNDVIQFDSESKIQPVTIGGKNFYALCESGDFNTDDIELPVVNVPKADISSTEADLPRFGQNASKGRRAPEDGVTYILEDINGQFNYSSEDALPKELKSIEAVGTDPFKFVLDLRVADPSDVINTLTFEDINIQIPKGLTVQDLGNSTYSPTTGIWHVDEIELPAGEKHVTLSITATAIDIKEAGVEINENNQFIFNGDFTIKYGVVHATPVIKNEVPSVLPEMAKVFIDYTLQSFDIIAFTGDIQYVDGINIDPVSLSDIPEFLQGDETVIKLSNPQIYLQLNNPVANDPIQLRGQLSLDAIRGEADPLTFTPEEDIVLGNNHGIAGPYSFALAPNRNNLNVPTPGNPANNMVDYTKNMEFIPFPSLSSLLVPASGEHGLPDQIGIHFNVPETHVTDFALGRTLTGVKGDYELIAPLGLLDDSHIIYQEDVTGWGDNDLADLTVTKLRVTARATNNTPVAISLSVRPLSPGDPDPVVIPGAELTSNVIAAGSTSDLVIEFVNDNVEVTNLDGIRLNAVLNGGSDSNPLSPDQTLVLEDLRVTVSGYYNAKLDD